VSDCPYCGAALPSGPPWAPGEGFRLAYDPHKGRLWNVCSQCSRWTLTPLEARWESLEACEDAVRTQGSVLLSTDHLTLVRVREGDLIRVGDPPRLEFVDWRYGPRLSEARPKMAFWARLLSRLPPPPVGGYDPYRGFEGALRGAPWFASPFLESASTLTYLFSHVPLAHRCPSCSGPLAVEPWAFQNVALVGSSGSPHLRTRCGLCGTDVVVDLEEARPALRMGLTLVTDSRVIHGLAQGAATALDSVGGPEAYLARLSRSEVALGDLDSAQRAGLIITLDEQAEMAALEAEWREAEEMAEIMDGDLSQVPGFEAFRRQILEGEG